ncbi:melatonin receptor type 1B-B-like [Nematostella vectensis]|uniref:melatonin receptor type 1B-B-like n=1 Tax=Nematostella vectensis TaxID=45351 RepID=UPI0020779BBA|nr:melatonin receptor type 1B-B-like [Nematostella vectensis]
MPMSTSVLLTSRWIFGKFICQCEGFLAIVMAAASTQTLAVTAINRYFGIVKCLLYRAYFTKKRTTILILGVWTLSFIAPLPYLFAGFEFVFHPGKLFCYVPLRASWYLVFIVAIYVTLPSCVILFCYTRVFYTIRQRNKLFQKTRERGSAISTDDIRVTKVLFVIVLFYFLCWSPVLVIDLVDTISGNMATPREGYISYTFQQLR